MTTFSRIHNWFSICHPSKYVVHQAYKNTQLLRVYRKFFLSGLMAVRWIISTIYDVSQEDESLVLWWGWLQSIIRKNECQFWKAPHLFMFSWHCLNLGFTKFRTKDEPQFGQKNWITVGQDHKTYQNRHSTSPVGCFDCVVFWFYMRMCLVRTPRMPHFSLKCQPKQAATKLRIVSYVINVAVWADGIGYWCVDTTGFRVSLPNHVLPTKLFGACSFWTRCCSTPRFQIKSGDVSQSN